MKKVNSNRNRHAEGNRIIKAEYRFRNGGPTNKVFVYGCYYSTDCKETIRAFIKERQAKAIDL